MSLWDWTLQAYGQAGVPEACLDLQDEHGQNTPFLLWAVWAEGPKPEILAEAARMAKAWEAAVLAPIRKVRRTLKPPFPLVDDRAREALRDDIKAAELRAERVLMETLEQLSGHHKNGVPALEALKAATAAWGGGASDDALARLAGPLT
ncbi:TIGR02444 family protein [Phenylobacterium aquaticum]|uniref:TIGR02444 family protein n=1 Tax=Phenylobacterium aquaticum TaxID=1763816 RepID=UPI0026EADDD9|nr:TIGR02444 family protein [Phenylobacterium aquaticum]